MSPKLIEFIGSLIVLVFNDICWMVGQIGKIVSLLRRNSNHYSLLLL